MNTTNEQIADLLVRHRLWLLRYEAGATKEVVDAYDAFVGDLFKELARLEKKIGKGQTLDAADRIRVRAILASLPAAQNATYGEIMQIMDDRMAEVAESEPKAITDALRVALPKGVTDAGVKVARVPEADALVALLEPLGGTRWRAALARDLVEASETLQATLAQAVIQGASMDDAARMIRQTGSIIQTYRGRFVTIARTEIQRVAATAAAETFRANKGLIKGVQRLATLDTRTCTICAPLHNKEYPLGQNGEAIYPKGEGPTPLHQRCRCFDSPITKSWKELGIDLPDNRTKRRMDGNAVEGMTFDGWLRRQPQADQIESLGPTRWQAWTSGTLSLDQFADHGRLLSLGQLRARYPDALPDPEE